MKLFVFGVLAVVAVGCSPVHARSNRVAASPPIDSTTNVDTSSTSVDTTTTATTVLDPTTAETTVPTTVAPTTVPAPVPTAPKSTASVASVTAGSGFEQCVIVRESGGNPHVGSGGLYGILPSTWHSLGRGGTAGGASVAEQKAAFDQLYAKDGKSPWSGYDGCR